MALSLIAAPSRIDLFLFALASALFMATGRHVDAAERSPQYNREVRPILAENCFACHGPDSASRKGDLRLDRREAAIDAGDLVAGKPDESEIIARINSSDPKQVMPPPASKKTLTAAEKLTLAKWIAAGAEYQPHWSYIAPRRPALPDVKNPAWARNAIDRFVLAKLDEQGLLPAAEADPRTLARRLSLDLTGLPPSPEFVDGYLNDRSPDAYEKLVDRLMQSKAWGEHRGRYWLDAARYADTNGIHIDNYREIWTYRDWVIDAFNRNLPFDQFTIEQLAGDLLPNPTIEQKIATGFNRCNITTSEGGAIAEEYSVLYTRDRTETVSQVWLGLSMNCAVCHDHKFDPLKQREFYEMAAFFNNTTQAAMDGNIKDTPPVIAVVARQDQASFDQLGTDIAAAKASVEERLTTAKPAFHQWLASDDAKPQNIKVPSEGLAFHAPLDEGEGNLLHCQVDGKPRELQVKANIDWQDSPGGKAFRSEPGAVELADVGDFDTKQPFSVSLWIKLTNVNQTGSLLARMDEKQDFRGWDLWLQNGRIGTHQVSKWPNDALKVVAKNSIKPNVWTHVAVSHNGNNLPAGVKIYINGELQKVEVENKTLKGTTHTTAPFKIATRNNSSPLQDLAIHDLRIYRQAIKQPEVERLAKADRVIGLLLKSDTKRTNKETDELFKWWLNSSDKPFAERNAELANLEQQRAAIQSHGSVAHVMQEKAEMPQAFVLYRGQYDQRRDQVKPGTPAALPPFTDDLPRTRLGLAKWLLRPDQPLTARVTVNRFWQEMFGAGIVKTTGDFGVSGELPSHQELLDWMAVEFRESGWDIRHMYKLMVMSATYRQAATITPEKLEKDPQNRWLSRGPRFRMDAEMVRDYALAASGLLVPKIGGPSVRPYQPPGVWEAVAMPNSNTRNYKPDSGEGLYRRSMYTFWKRSAPPASMDVFNAPTREWCVTRRERTDTPLQALVTLNDPQFVEAARRLAENTLKASDREDARFDFMAQRLLARPLKPTETKIIAASLARLSKFYSEHNDDAKQLVAVGDSPADPKIDLPQLASWTMLANELLNLDEVLNK